MRGVPAQNLYEEADMKLFLGENCPQCEGLKKRIDLATVPGLTVYNVGEPDSEESAKALAEADLYDIWGVPALVTADGAVVRDAFQILDFLKEACA